MLHVEDPRSWFAIGALAIALILTAGSANGTLRFGYHAGRGHYCFADTAAGSAAKVLRPIAAERAAEKG